MNRLRLLLTLTLTFVLAAFGFGFWHCPVVANDSLPNLQGEAAIQYLKQHGIYDSLLASVAFASDCTWTEKRKLVALDGEAQEYFGFWVAISGDTAIIGARNDDRGKGAAYIFERNQGGINNWGVVKKLTASDGLEFRGFGDSVAIDSNTAIVGIITPARGDRGAAYIYERNHGGTNNWGEVKILTASDGAVEDSFGRVAISGDIVIVGAYINNDGKGSAYIFERNNGGAGNWGEVKKLVASDGAVSDLFGSVVAINGNTAIIGAWLKDNQKGATYVFERNWGGANNWGEAKKLTASDGATGDQFGAPVTISGDTVIVGALLSNDEKGAAYIYKRNQGGADNWGEFKKLTASDGEVGDHFGQAVISGDTAIVGANSDDARKGSVYIFERNQGGTSNWGEVKKLTASDGEAGDFFAAAGIDGNTAIVGAFHDDDSKGAAYIFICEPNMSPTISPIGITRQQGSASANSQIATATDGEDAENTLQAQISSDGVNFSNTATLNGVTVTLTDSDGGATGVNPNATGQVFADVVAACGATNAGFTLKVTDSTIMTATTTLNVIVTPNTPPVLSYGSQTVIAGTTPEISALTGPSDNGTLNPLTLSVSPPSGLTLNLNAGTGQISVVSASVIGNYTVTVTATDNCNAVTTATFTVSVVCPAISLSPANLPGGQINSPYNQTVSAAPGGTTYSFSVTSGSLPPGLSLVGNGTITGSPTTEGTFTFRITATGWGGCTAFRDYTVIIACTAITLNPTSLPGGTIGASYNQSVSATPAGTYGYTVTSGALPPGLTLNAATGAITGTPATVGSFNFTITAAAGGCSGSRSYTVAVGCQTISITTTSPLPAGAAGIAYSQTLNVTPAGSYTFSLVSGNLPSGIMLNATTGALGGTATVPNTYTFTVRVQAANGCEATRSFTLVISCPAVTLAPASLPGGTVGTAYSQTLAASPAGGNYIYTYTGNLPAGLSLNSSTGVLSGTPTANDSYTFTVMATGFGGCTGSRSYTVAIGGGGGGCAAIALPASVANGSVGQLYSQSVVASPSGHYSYAVTSGSLPPGVTLYPNGLLFGYPTTPPGSYSFTVTATQEACSGSQSYTVLIGAGMASSLTALSDFDGDGKSDLSIWRGTDGNWLVANSGDGQVQATPWGASSAPYNDVAVPGDYDGDGKTDWAVFRRGGEHAGYWFIKRSSDGQVMSRFWGLGTDVPVPGDYDGDGKTDVAVWRGSTGGWYVWRSSDGGVTGIVWGSLSAGDAPVAGDYDGDGKTDVAVFRRGIQPGQGGDWLIRRSSEGQALSVKWGVGSDVPVPGDYDGDGKTDLAVWRGAAGAWHILQSSNAGIRTVTLDIATQGDWAVPGDYDGDGKADAAIWREATGVWFVKRSSDDAVMSKAFGQSGDAPVAARRN